MCAYLPLVKSLLLSFYFTCIAVRMSRMMMFITTDVSVMAHCVLSVGVSRQESLYLSEALESTCVCMCIYIYMRLEHGLLLRPATFLV